jgi:hypothetical protein
MSDGVRVAMDIYLPDQEGKYPALLSICPYTKELQATASKNLNNEAGDTQFFVSRGYVHVIADTRGNGHSEGAYALCSDREIEDGAELVRWIARQPWCDGNVSIMGMSYFAINAMLIAAKNPPHLKCIFPYDGLEDFYRDIVYHGGIFCSGFAISWSLLTLITNMITLRGEKGGGHRLTISPS